MVPVESTGEVQPGDTGLEETLDPVGVPELSPEEQRQVDDLRKFRDRLTDVSDARIELIVEGAPAAAVDPQLRPRGRRVRMPRSRPRHCSGRTTSRRETSWNAQRMPGSWPP